LKKKHYIIQIITTEKKLPFTLRLNATLLRFVGLALIMLIVGIVTFSYIYIPRALDYNRLKEENDRLIKDRLELAKILADYNRIRQMDHYIRKVLGTDLALSPIDSIPFDSLYSQNNFAPEANTIEISFLDNMPITPPVDGGYITQGFITDNLFEEDNHYGIDIAAPEGTPVKASASGVVIFSNWSYHYGNLIIIYHQGGYFTIYGHNQRNIVKEHQHVQRGEVIAFVGNTGESEGPHLHFEIWKDGVPLDPQKIIYAYRDKNISFSSMEGQ